MAFCETLPGNTAVGAYASESQLWVQVGRSMADQLRADQLAAERLVLSWMKAWKQLSGSQSVTVIVKWGDIRMATGQTTPSQGDHVTLIGPRS